MDRRIKYTKNIIKETLITLLNEKDINKITVSEICKTADINRATFYRYYLDVYDLFEKIKDEFTQEIIEAVKKADNKVTIFNFSKEILEVLLNNKSLVKVLFNTKNSIYILDEMLEISYNSCREKWLNDVETLSNEEIDNAAVFIYNGALGVINYWVKNDFDQDIDKISKTIEQLSCYGIKRYIYKK